MALNPFFRNYDSANEQSLLDGLIIESIQTYGLNCIYLPRHDTNPDKLYGTSDIVDFSDSYQIEGYLAAIDGFNDTSNIFSKFGLQINDQITLAVSKTRFDAAVGSLANIPRPREGDLIFEPLTKKCFEIKFSDNKKIFYPLGALQTYHLTCELYQYSSERFNTGIPDIDRIQEYSKDILSRSILTEDGFYLTTEDGSFITWDNDLPEDLDSVIDDSTEVKTESSVFINFSEDNPFAEKF